MRADDEYWDWVLFEMCTWRDEGFVGNSEPLSEDSPFKNIAVIQKLLKDTSKLRIQSAV